MQPLGHPASAGLGLFPRGCIPSRTPDQPMSKNKYCTMRFFRTISYFMRALFINFDWGQARFQTKEFSKSWLSPLWMEYKNYDIIDRHILGSNRRPSSKQATSWPTTSPSTPTLSRSSAAIHPKACPPNWAGSSSNMPAKTWAAASKSSWMTMTRAGLNASSSCPTHRQLDQSTVFKPFFANKTRHAIS